MRVLQAGSEHCCSWVRRFGFGGVGVEVPDVPRAFSALALAHAPALEQECTVSDRWSRQKMLWQFVVSVVAYKYSPGTEHSPFAALAFEG